MASTCVQHPEAAAVYRCDGCGEFLCEACAEESHALFLCRLCGERALPLEERRAATPRGLERQRRVETPYSLSEALLYPFRGSGLFMFVAALLTSGFIWAVGLVAGCAGLILHIGFWLLIVGLQFKIVRSTVEGENELPDWPDFSDVGSLVQDFLTWLFIHVLILGAMMVFGSAFFLSSVFGAVFTPEPRLGFWLAFGVVLWLGAAFAVMAYGAVGNYRRLKVFAVHSHVAGFFAAPVDAVNLTNIVFALAAVVLVVRSYLEATIPLLGAILSAAIGVYWLFMLPHLSGLLFRRHDQKMDEIYWAEGG